jgi:O-antigen ligase
MRAAQLGGTILVLAAALAFGQVGWLLAASMAGFVTLLFLLLPWTAALLSALALPVASGIEIGPASLTELLLGGMLLVWLVAGSARGSLRFARHPLVGPAILYVVVLGFAALVARDLGEAAKEVVKWCEFVAVLLLIPVLVPQDRARWLVAALAAAAVGQAVLGLYQFWNGIGPEWFIVLERFMRASGSFRQPNPYAGYLGITLPVLLGLALPYWGRVIRSPRTRTDLAWALFYSVCTAVVAAGLLVSWSRGGWLGAAVGTGVVLVAYSWQTAALAGVAAVAAGMLSLRGAPITQAATELTPRLQGLSDWLAPADLLAQPVTDENFAVLERLAHWVAAWRMFEASPWIGVGPGNFATAYAEYRLPLWEDALGHAHNIYLNVAAETGLVGVLAFVFFLGYAVVWTWGLTRPRLSASPDEQVARALAVGVLGTLGYIAVHSIFDNLFVQGIYLQLAFLLAALAAAQSVSLNHRHESQRSPC